MSRNDGGPAFPCVFSDGDGNSVTIEGMSLRDWFAGQALIGIIQTPDFDYDDDGVSRPANSDAEIATAAYQVADAMIAARDGAR